MSYKDGNWGSSTIATDKSTPGVPFLRNQQATVFGSFKASTATKEGERLLQPHPYALRLSLETVTSQAAAQPEATLSFRDDAVESIQPIEWIR